MESSARFFPVVVLTSHFTLLKLSLITTLLQISSLSHNWRNLLAKICLTCPLARGWMWVNDSVILQEYQALSLAPFRINSDPKNIVASHFADTIMKSCHILTIWWLIFAQSDLTPGLVSPRSCPAEQQWDLGYQHRRSNYFGKVVCFDNCIGLQKLDDLPNTKKDLHSGSFPN